MKPALIVIFFVFLSLPTSAQLKFIAHRGASYYAPENTLASIKLAAELGCDGAECDIRLTKDNQIILWHDDNTGRLTNQKLEISNSNWSDLKKLNIRLSPANSLFFAGERMTRLKDVLKSMTQDQLLVIEIKCGKEIFPELIKVVQKDWKAGKIAFIAFNLETINLAKSLFPLVPCYYLSYKKGDLVNKIPEILKNRLDGVDLNSGIIDKELVDILKSAGLDIWSWTVDDLNEAKRLKELGVNVITTNRPTWLKEQLK